jgi:hypothetical protein
MEKADRMRTAKIDENSKSPIIWWSDEDFDRRFDIFSSDDSSNINKAPERIFRNWEEEWETEAIFKKSPISEAKLLEKYGGLSWYDLDNEQMVYSDVDELKWNRVTRGKKGEGRSGGYAVLAYDEKYNKELDNAEDHSEPWAFSEDLRGSIAEYYENHPELGVKVWNLEADDTENNDEATPTDVARASNIHE